MRIYINVNLDSEYFYSPTKPAEEHKFSSRLDRYRIAMIIHRIGMDVMDGRCFGSIDVESNHIGQWEIEE